MYGIQLVVRNKPSAWTTHKGERLQFATHEEAQQELQHWHTNGWWPSTIHYVVKEIEE